MTDVPDDKDTDSEVPAFRYVPKARAAAVSDFELGLRERYLYTRSRQAAEGPLALLQIGGERCGMILGTQAVPGETILLDIGWRRTAREFLAHSPPRAGELERAIQGVEDALGPALRRLPTARLAWCTTDGIAGDIARCAGVAATVPMQLERAAVEGVWQRVQAIAQGAPAGIADLLLCEGAFAAAVLILREFLHHGDVATLTIWA